MQRQVQAELIQLLLDGLGIGQIGGDQVQYIGEVVAYFLGDLLIVFIQRDAREVLAQFKGQAFNILQCLDLIMVNDFPGPDVVVDLLHALAVHEHLACEDFQFAAYAQKVGAQRTPATCMPVDKVETFQKVFRFKPDTGTF